MKLRSLWRRPAVKREIDEELRFPVEQRTAENIAAHGLSQDAPAAAPPPHQGRRVNVPAHRSGRATRGVSLELTS